ncbi:MAG: GWxTD domain-containing protein, partial [Gemmatimonadetes bacterium]|nr:GWxTD domain-containing protein [Gemmatimonadota bacterium]
LLWQSRLAAALGDTAAVAAAERYASRGGDASLASLARARALFSTGRDSAGADAYFAGVEALTHDGAVAYYADLTPLLHEAERKEWQTATTAERSDWLRRFWARRSAGAGVSPGERVAEHYARLAIASERYRRTSERTASIADARAVQHGLHGFGLDDRGVMYVLHGKPDSVVRTRGPGVLPNETWVYRQPVGQNRLVHFVALRRAAEYVLVADPLLALAGPSDASASICDPLDCGLPDAVLELLEDRAPFDPRYGLLAGRFRGRVLAGRSERTSDAAAAAAQDFASASLAVAGEVQAATDEALRRDSFRPTLGEPIPFYYDVYAFRGEAGRTDLLLAAAVPGERLEPQPGDAGLLYPIEVRFLVVDSAAAQTFDTSLARLYQSSKPLGPGQHLRTILALSLPAGSYQHTVVLKNPRAERAGGAYGGSLTVPDFRGDSLMISDLVLGESSGRGLRRGEVDVAPVPPRQFPSGAAVGLFYEVYNLPPGVLYRTRIRVEPLRGKSVFARLKGLFGGETAPLALAFDESAAPESSGVQRVFRRVELGNLKPGPYRLSVETRVGEDTTRRSTEFVIQ